MREADTVKVLRNRSELHNYNNQFSWTLIIYALANTTAEFSSKGAAN